MKYKSILHVECGNDTWTPTSEELLAITDSFSSVNDGGVVATRDGVTATWVQPDYEESEDDESPSGDEDDDFIDDVDGEPHDEDLM